MFIDIPKENENEYNIGMMGILPKSSLKPETKKP